METRFRRFRKPNPTCAFFMWLTRRDRHDPGTGEMKWDEIYKAIGKTGYAGYVATGNISRARRRSGQLNQGGHADAQRINSVSAGLAHIRIDNGKITRCSSSSLTSPR